MGRASASAAAVVLALGLVVPGQAMAAGPAPAKVNPKYQVCDPNEWPGANPKYPFSFLLTTKYQNTKNARIRAAVKSIQRVINDRVWGDQLTDPVVLKVDGRYGPKTAAAVKKFQKANKITVDGKVGKQTWRVLAAYCGSD